MKLEFPLLGLLASHRMSGYEIKKWLDTEGQFLGLDRYASQIYRELNKMQVDGWVKFDVEARDGAPDAKIYQLTDKGMERLVRWVHGRYEPPRRFQAPEFSCRLQFTAMIDPAKAADLTRQELEFRVLQVQENRDRDRRIRSTDPRPEIDLTVLQFISDEQHHYGMGAVDLWIDWLRQLLQKLESMNTVSTSEAEDR